MRRTFREFLHSNDTEWDFLSLSHPMSREFFRQLVERMRQLKKIKTLRITKHAAMGPNWGAAFLRAIEGCLIDNLHLDGFQYYCTMALLANHIHSNPALNRLKIWHFADDIAGLNLLELSLSGRKLKHLSLWLCDDFNSASLEILIRIIQNQSPDSFAITSKQVMTFIPKIPVSVTELDISYNTLTSIEATALARLIQENRITSLNINNSMDYPTFKKIAKALEEVGLIETLHMRSIPLHFPDSADTLSSLLKCCNHLRTLGITLHTVYSHEADKQIWESLAHSTVTHLVLGNVFLIDHSIASLTNVLNISSLETLDLSKYTPEPAHILRFMKKLPTNQTLKKLWMGQFRLSIDHHDIFNAIKSVLMQNTRLEEISFALMPNDGLSPIQIDTFLELQQANPQIQLKIFRPERRQELGDARTLSVLDKFSEKNAALKMPARISRYGAITGFGLFAKQHLNRFWDSNLLNVVADLTVEKTSPLDTQTASEVENFYSRAICR